MGLRIGAIVLLSILAACGTSRMDRAASGAAIGAGTGGLGALVLDGDVGAGVVTGALVGAGVGALTDSNDFDLGTPVWRRGY